MKIVLLGIFILHMFLLFLSPLVALLWLDRLCIPEYTKTVENENTPE